MDWKRFYADEIASPRGRAAALAAVDRHAGGHATVQALLRAGGVASFPHVSLRDSAEPIACVAQAILATGARRVVALGVLHGGTLPAPYRELQAALRGETAQAGVAFRQLRGAFIARGPASTPFGCIDEGAVPPLGDVIRDDAALLSGEFSLDLFLSLLAAAALARGVRPPPVTRLYVSATRSPSGSFQTAAELAGAIRALLDESSVCVATGDLVHIGHGYTPAAEVTALPTDAAALTALLLPQLHEMHAAALARRDFAAAWALGTRLMSDQRHLLPVIAELLGPGATAELLSFGLSDYAAINGVAAPSFVAAAFTLFRPAALRA